MVAVGLGPTAAWGGRGAFGGLGGPRTPNLPRATAAPWPCQLPRGGAEGTVLGFGGLPVCPWRAAAAGCGHAARRAREEPEGTGWTGSGPVPPPHRYRERGRGGPGGPATGTWPGSRSPAVCRHRPSAGSRGPRRFGTLPAPLPRCPRTARWHQGRGGRAAGAGTVTRHRALRRGARRHRWATGSPRGLRRTP